MKALARMVVVAVAALGALGLAALVAAPRNPPWVLLEDYSIPPQRPYPKHIELEPR